MAYLKQQYKVVGLVFAILCLIFLFMAFVLHAQNEVVPFAFLTGGFFSGLCGFLGMKTATNASARTACAAQSSLNEGLRVAFRAGAVMGLVVVGFALLDIAAWFLILYYLFPKIFPGFLAENPLPQITVIMLSFGMGASTQALFARVGGGIYTKAADVGADLVGKVEAGIPEDDPRNPAVIADNVGDNVGDVAGMGADLFESFVGSIIATVTLAEGDVALMALPFWLAGAGVLSSWIGYWFVSTKDDASQKDLLHALHKAVHSASFLVIVFSIFICWGLFPGRQSDGWRCFGCIILGLFCGVLIGELTEYFTSYSHKPVKSITVAGLTGPATVIIQGLGVGMISCVGPIFVIVFTVICCNALAGEYGIAIAAVGMLSTLAVTLATDAYGPVADNAGGIAEMAELDERVRDTN